MSARPALPAHVTIVEVGPRDGLQNEAAAIPTATKIAFIDALSDAGLPVIETTAFVSARRVPQMADAREVVRGIRRREATRYTALVPNRQGLDQAIALGLGEVAIFAAASETFSRRNINRSIDDALLLYADVTAGALARGLRVRGYLSTVFGCPFEGAVPVERVSALTQRLLEMGVFEVALSDTIGVATPRQIDEVVGTVAARVPRERLALHLHDTRGTALANVYAGLQAGIAVFDASAGGLGGCPFAPGAAGNLATEDLVYLLRGLGIETGVDLDAVVRASRLIAPAVGHPLPSRYLQSRGPEPDLPGARG
jgi:hydroxymethylglutaryl-CoA lyase